MYMCIYTFKFIYIYTYVCIHVGIIVYTAHAQMIAAELPSLQAKMTWPGAGDGYSPKIKHGQWMKTLGNPNQKMANMEWENRRK